MLDEVLRGNYVSDFPDTWGPATWERIIPRVKAANSRHYSNLFRLDEFRFCLQQMKEYTKSWDTEHLRYTLVQLAIDLAYTDVDFELQQKKRRRQDNSITVLTRKIKNQTNQIKKLKERVTSLEHPTSLLPAIDPNSFEWNVYFLQSDSNGFIKIGKTSTAAKRLKNIKTMSPVPLRFVGGLMAEDNHQLEHQLHDRFAAYRAHGEWFEAADVLVSYINNIRAGGSA